MRRATPASFYAGEEEAEWHDRESDNGGEKENIGIAEHLSLRPVDLIDPPHGNIMRHTRRISHRRQRPFVTRDQLVERLMERRGPLREIGLVDLRPLDNHSARQGNSNRSEDISEHRKKRRRVTIQLAR